MMEQSGTSWFRRTTTDSRACVNRIRSTLPNTPRILSSWRCTNLRMALLPKRRASVLFKQDPSMGSNTGWENDEADDETAVGLPNRHGPGHDRGRLPRGPRRSGKVRTADETSNRNGWQSSSSPRCPISGSSPVRQKAIDMVRRLGPTDIKSRFAGCGSTCLLTTHIAQTPRKKDFATYRFIRRSRSGHAIRMANGSFTHTGRWRWKIDVAVSNSHGRCPNSTLPGEKPLCTRYFSCWRSRASVRLPS